VKRYFAVAALAGMVLLSSSTQSYGGFASDMRKQIVDKLTTIEGMYLSKLDPEERDKAARLLGEVIGQVDSLVAMASAATGVSAESAGPSPVLSDANYDVLMKAFTRAYRDEDKLALVQATIGKHGLILCSQLRGIVKALSFPSSKIACIKTYYAQLYDKANIAEVLAELSYWDQKEVLDWIAKLP
jgi:hypothetical protein